MIWIETITEMGFKYAPYVLVLALRVVLTTYALRQWVAAAGITLSVGIVNATDRYIEHNSKLSAYSSLTLVFWLYFPLRYWP